MTGPTALNEKNRRLCLECVDDEYLRGQIENDGEDGACFYCEQHAKTFSLDQIADRINRVLPAFYRHIPKEQEDVIAQAKGRRPEGQSLAEVIRDMGVGYAAADDIRHVLSTRHDDMEEDQDHFGEGRFEPDAHYLRKASVDDRDFGTQWYWFKERLKTENRYFNRDAEVFLTSLFEGIEAHNTISGGPIVAQAGPGTNIQNLYRARVFQAERSLREAMKRPHKHLGPPPASVANPGRMNAGGISVFYGATDPSVALAEVRPPVGSKVLIGRFEVIQALRLLDLEALESIDFEKGSMFDPAHLCHLQRAEFLRGLADLISKPIMPDDQPNEYLPTQAIADFLASAVDPPLDGMIYPSAQVGHVPRARRFRVLGGTKDKRNVVLFHKAARVQPLDIPSGSTISVIDDTNNWADLILGDSFGSPCDAPGLKYTVWEEVPNTAASSGLDDAPLKFTSLDVHFVYGVRIDTISSPVNRYTVVKSEAPEKT